MDETDVKVVLRALALERKMLARAAAAARTAGRDQIAEGYVVLLQEVYSVEARVTRFGEALKRGGEDASVKKK